MGSHSLLSPSATDRWANCTASIALCKDIQRKSSTYADEGSFAHEVAAWILEGKHGDKPKSIYSSEELDKYVYEYINYIRMYKTESELIEIEKLVKIDVIRGWGTVDCFIIKEDILHIFDLKYGRGKRVYAENNSQLKLYAYGVLQYLNMIFNIKEVELHIVQPRINKNGLYTSWVTSKKSIEKWVDDKIKPAVDLILEDKGTNYKEGEWCWFCPGRQMCAHMIGSEYDEKI